MAHELPLTQEVIESVLQEYMEHIAPAMLAANYHLTLVKGGPAYPHLSEQSHFAHIINGAFGLVALLRFLVDQNVRVRALTEKTVRQALALFTVHEVHKAGDYDKLDHTEFGIPLERLRREYEQLGLDNFAPADEHLLRMANIHKRSPKQADMLLTRDDGALLWTLVRIADTMASMTSPTEYSALANYLQRLGPAFVPDSSYGRFRLYFHEINDVRGVLTNVLHQAVASQLEREAGFSPLLVFTTGSLYLGPAHLNGISQEQLIERAVTRTLAALTEAGDNADAIKDGLRRQKYDFEKYVFAFASVSRLLEVVYEETILAKPDPKLALKELDGLATKRADLPDDWRNTIEERLGLELLDSDQHRAFYEQWSLVRRYLLYVDTLLRDINPDEARLEWFLRSFDVPFSVAENLRAEADVWARGGVGKYVLIIAYHFLRGPHFSDRSSESLSTAQVLERLHLHVLEAMQQLDTSAGRQAAVSALGFRQDLTTYLQAHLSVSFDPSGTLDQDGFFAYTLKKRKGHSSTLCSLCNRQSEYVQELRTGILDDFGRVFSNRVLPAVEAPGGNRPWCPVCHLEFIFRKLSGLGLETGTHYKKSIAIYLYVLPTFSFTRDHERLFERVLEPFKKATKFPIRDFGSNWGVPHYWSEKQQLDQEWQDTLLGVLARETDRLAERAFAGERLLSGVTSEQPHYYLIKWEKAARETESDDARIATRTEAWAKALFAAAAISSLTSCKVFVTERPYLPVNNPTELKPTIILDSPPPVLRGLLEPPVPGGSGDSRLAYSDVVSLYGREDGKKSGLELVLDLCAAIWTVTVDTHAPNRLTKDKQIAARLGTLNVQPLAGAHFYKEFSRLNDGETPPSQLRHACTLLLESKGGELMDIVEALGEKALAIRLPFRGRRRGKVHNYELVFREAMNALNRSFAPVPELRETAVSGERPSEQAIAELKSLASGHLLKAMQRRAITGRGEGIINPWRQDLNQLTGEMIDLLVDEVLLVRARGSFARFLRLENTLADGIYYYTDRHLSRLWDEYEKQKVAQILEEAQS